MNIQFSEAKSILRKQTKVDSWFLSRYGMNLYRGCAHNCVYCDGRAEKYYVDGEFGKDLIVKTNALALLQKELDPARKRVPMGKGYVLLGGGVTDVYQPIEKKYQLARGALELIHQFKHPVHILTKSVLVENDLDLLKEINTHNRVIVSFSFSSTNEKLGAIFEPGAASPAKRLETIHRIKSNGLACGMFLMPVIPFVTDTPDIIRETVKEAVDAGVDFIIFGGLTLKTGRQRDYFEDVLRQHFPHLAAEYAFLYQDDQWGNANPEYYKALNNLFYQIASEYKMPVRMPWKYFHDILDENDRIMIALEHIDYIFRIRGFQSPYGYAAHSISKITEPLSALRGKLKTIKGVSDVIRKVIAELLDTGKSTFLDDLMSYKI